MATRRPQFAKNAFRLTGRRWSSGTSLSQWPLAYQMQRKFVPHERLAARRPKVVARLKKEAKTQPIQWWSHTMYQGPTGEPVQVDYSSTLEEMEQLARTFLQEPVLGLDMEWKWESSDQDPLKDQVSLIQLACEDRIAMFHIARCPGDTAEALIAPSLRRIIEDPGIVKVGVSIHSSDFLRLRQHFGLAPRSAFELSYLHQLVEHGPTEPARVTTRYTSLAALVRQYFGLQLSKAATRTDWSAALDDAQRRYAADDVYAAFMLYHCMTAKRLAMDPTPPPPLCADLYLPWQAERPPEQTLRLGPTTTTTTTMPDDGAGYVTAVDFFFGGECDETRAEALFARLREERFRAARALDPDQPRNVKVASERLLRQLARKRPSSTEALRLIRGANAVKIREHGDAWLRVIAEFCEEKGLPMDVVPRPKGMGKTKNKGRGRMAALNGVVAATGAAAGGGVLERRSGAPARDGAAAKETAARAGVVNFFARLFKG